MLSKIYCPWLYDKISRAEVLAHAWQFVRANRGSPGVDGISFEAIENGIGIETFLRELARDLKDKTYQAQPVRHVLERLDLSLNEAKTHVVDATQASFDFLGFTIQMSLEPALASRTRMCERRTNR